MKKCRVCKSTKVSHGEQRWWWWVWWCDKCYKLYFCKQVLSNPILTQKYKSIYGDSPQKVLGVK